MVGLFADRSLEMVTAILGILKAGAAYVPLDPSNPPARTQYMVADAGVALILSQSHLSGQLPESAAKVIWLDADDPLDGVAAGGDAHDGGRLAVTDQHAAYVIYTSGSTGKPKGVVVEHRNVVRLFESCREHFQFDENDCWTLFHSFAFDFSVWEIWGALACGGRLVIVPYLVSRSPAQFYALLAAEKVTILNQTPLAFLQLIRVEDAPAARQPLALRTVIFGGSTLDFTTLRPWFERHGDTQPRLVNMYGITETTVFTTYRPLTIADLDARNGSCIGIPIPDTDLFVLDAALRPCPVGETGELVVGGPSVARGYLHRPELTAERFIPHPWRTGELLYKSGDLARRTPDGDLEYLGRADQQVKIRGFRIELGEIEAALLRHPAVAQCVVIARAAAEGDSDLVAYFVPTAPATEAELRACLLVHLPAYMVPSAFIPLDAIPLNQNGKLDRAALPAPAATRPELTTSFVAPTSATEQSVAAVWRSVLLLDRVGARDNFFDLGGNSLRLALLHHRLQQQSAREFPMVTLFQYPTVAAFAAFLDGATATTTTEPFTATDRAAKQREALARLRVGVATSR
ncbi:MAG: amino acid adenylation domain-containing protein, partial [Chthoniobacter sp.]|nr:amino acid adenylation domain-containing protein [Chthoniobacter sp.]